VIREYDGKSPDNVGDVLASDVLEPSDFSGGVLANSTFKRTDDPILVFSTSQLRSDIKPGTISKEYLYSDFHDIYSLCFIDGPAFNGSEYPKSPYDINEDWYSFKLGVELNPFFCKTTVR